MAALNISLLSLMCAAFVWIGLISASAWRMGQGLSAEPVSKASRRFSAASGLVTMGSTSCFGGLRSSLVMILVAQLKSCARRSFVALALGHRDMSAFCFGSPA